MAPGSAAAPDLGTAPAGPQEETPELGLPPLSRKCRASTHTVPSWRMEKMDRTPTHACPSENLMQSDLYVDLERGLKGSIFYHWLGLGIFKSPGFTFILCFFPPLRHKCFSVLLRSQCNYHLNGCVVQIPKVDSPISLMPPRGT